MSTSYKIDKEKYAKIPILKLAVEGNLQEIKALISSSQKDEVNYTHKKSGDTPLKLASRYGHHNLVMYLLEEFADIEHRDFDGKTALHDAAQNGNSKCVEVLLKFGADVDALKRADWYGIML